MASFGNCLRKEHPDMHASAIFNDSSDSYYPGSVHCFGCQKWYLKAHPNMSFNTYGELLSFVKEGKDPDQIPNNEFDAEKEDAIPFKAIKISNGKRNYKSRDNFYGRTKKSFLKDNETFILDKDGNKVYTNKFPKFKADCFGTHETVKEYFYHKDFADGFYNRFAIDSDEADEELLERLNKICSFGIRGFWFILNKGNNKFQANISLYHTVSNDVDMQKLKSVAKFFNDIVGDDHMTNSFMKNPLYLASDRDINENNLVYGAQQTKLFGFDSHLQKDYEEFIGLEKDEDADIAWNKVWMPKISSREIEISFLDNELALNGSSKDICVIVPKKDLVMRNDLTWALPIELLYNETAGKYKRVKENDRIKYSEEEHSSITIDCYKKKSFLVNLRKEFKKEEYHKVDSVLPSIFKESFSAFSNFEEFYVERNNRINFKQDFNSITTENWISELFNNATIVIPTLKGLYQRGIFSTTNISVVEKNWDSILNISAKIDKKSSEILSMIPRNNLQQLIILYQLLSDYAYKCNILKLFDGFDTNLLSTNIKLAYIFTEEACYNGMEDYVICKNHKRYKDVINGIKLLKEYNFSLYKQVFMSVFFINILNGLEISLDKIEIFKNLKVDSLKNKFFLLYNQRSSSMQNYKLMQEALVELEVINSLIELPNLQAEHFLEKPVIKTGHKHFENLKNIKPIDLRNRNYT